MRSKRQGAASSVSMQLKYLLEVLGSPPPTHLNLAMRFCSVPTGVAGQGSIAPSASCGRRHRSARLIQHSATRPRPVRMPKSSATGWNQLDFGKSERAGFLRECRFGSGISAWISGDTSHKSASQPRQPRARERPERSLQKNIFTISIDPTVNDVNKAVRSICAKTWKTLMIVSENWHKIDVWLRISGP